jgi:hypothetical protein
LVANNPGLIKKIDQVVHFYKKFSQIFENWYTALVNAAITDLGQGLPLYSPLLLHPLFSLNPPTIPFTLLLSPPIFFFMYNLEKHEKLVNSLENHLEDIEREVKAICKLNRNLEKRIEEIEQEEILTLAWLSAYPRGG